MNKFYLGIIAALVAIILLQRACTPKCTKTKELVTIYDTILKHDSSVIVKKMRINHRDTTYIPEDPIYVFDTIDHEAAKQTFNKLVKKHATKNMYIDTILIDTFGKIYIYDTVQFNELGNRGIVKNYTIPVYTKYIKVPEEPKRQVYVGGGLDGTYINKTVNINTAKAGVLYKNKKDQIYGATVGISINGYLVYGLQSYWKIKLKK
jgi:hypothetical protein